MKLIDTHAHIIKNFYKDENLDDIFKKAFQENVKKIIIPGTDENDSAFLSKLKKKNIYVAYGIHPSDVYKDSWKKITNLDFSNKNLVAIGEIGIDLYHETNPPLNLQIKEFEAQLKIALEHNLPVIIHMRNSDKEIYKILSKKIYKNLRFVMHSFTGNLDVAKKFLALGGYISFSGILTFKNAKEIQNAAKKIPLTKILIETDSPFLSPEPNRGKKNYPHNVKHVAVFLAKLRNEDLKKVTNQLWENSCKFFLI